MKRRGYVLQLGGDLAQWSSNGDDRYHLGMMAGYGHVKNRTYNNLTGYRATGRVDGYSIGVYGTYYGNNVEKTGLYVDGWMQYNWFKNNVKGEELAVEKYRSQSVSVSEESGYSFFLLKETKFSKPYMDAPGDASTGSMRFATI
ncbi:autotransporter outer membrane beta-barrel domain-containing protein [Citrobacter amalonaticus]|nr:autotransporter outer membrane beta-barrel domain-containing protein [Citrobacter amalonaticus]